MKPTKIVLEWILIIKENRSKGRSDNKRDSQTNITKEGETKIENIG